MTVSLTVTLDGLLEALGDMAARVDAETARAASIAALAVTAAAKKKASGRPGPNVITGSMRAHIGPTGPPRRVGPGRWTVSVAPTSVQSRRLELGFMNMRDSLGRLYHQPPFPYLKPGLDDASEATHRVATDAWRGALHG